MSNRPLLPIVAFCTALLLGSMGPVASAATCRPGLGVTPIEDIGATGMLLGVSATSGSDVWAVGNMADETAGLRLHWGGASWTEVPGPDPGVTDSLEDVSALAADDVWAVGAAFDGTVDHALAQHWNGTAWTTTPLILLQGLTGVDALAPDDVWAVGELLSIQRWDGTGWSAVSHPPFEDGDFHAVDALSTDDVWMVGAQESEGAGDHHFALHWDGVRTAVTPLPGLPSDESELLDVAAVSPSEVWAVGEQDKDSVKHTLIERWDGSEWHVVASPNPGADVNELTSIVALSPTDIWAAGTWAEGGIEHPLVVHWNGTRWARVHTQAVSKDDTITTFEAITAISSDDVWAVGAHGQDDVSLAPLAEHSRTCP